MLLFFNALVELNQACNEMMALATRCVHPETQKSYIKSISGGKNNSTEPVKVSISHPSVILLSLEA